MQFSKRIPELDGVRGIAILMVVLFHLPGFALPQGWVGVDIFFVLSGFLITTLLLTEYEESGRINLTQFYARRALRLLPALAILMLAYACSSVLLGWPWSDTVMVLAVMLFYCVNFARAF